jgi:hypothetical protein
MAQEQRTNKSPRAGATAKIDRGGRIPHERVTEISPLSTLLDAALAYAARGWSIIPTRAKKARFRWKQFQMERADEKLLRDWLGGRFADIDGIAVVCGRVSGELVVRDFDDEHSYHRWAEAYPRLAQRLPTTRTHRGYHVYGVATAGIVKLRDGELRGEGGYCLLPPSSHPSGSTYRWVNPLPEGRLPRIDLDRDGLRSDAPVRHSKHINVVGQGEAAVSAVSAVSQPALGDAVEAAIGRTLPRRPGQRNRRVFDFARRLQAIPDLAVAGLPTLRPIVAEWHRRALPVIRTKEFIETWADFIVAWGNVRCDADDGVVGAAFRHAVAAEMSPKVVALYPDLPAVHLLASLCRELQRDAGGKPFFLDCREAGRLIEVSHHTAWRLLAVTFPADGILVKVSSSSMASGLANEYRYVAD